VRSVAKDHKTSAARFYFRKQVSVRIRNLQLFLLELTVCILELFSQFSNYETSPIVPWQVQHFSVEYLFNFEDSMFEKNIISAYFKRFLIFFLKKFFYEKKYTYLEIFNISEITQPV
jgi:hypothetical protein